MRASRSSTPRSSTWCAIDGITGLAIVAGDKHSFWAGYPCKTLPPQPFDPVGVEFITGSISHQGLPRSPRRSSRRIIPCARSTSTTGRMARCSARSTRPCCTACGRTDAEGNRRRSPRTRGAQSGRLAAPHVRRLRRTRLRHRARVTGRARNRVRLHPAPDRAQRRGGRWPARLPRRASRALWAPASDPSCGRRSSRATPVSRSDAPRVSTEFPPVGVGRRNRDRVNRVTLAVKRGSSYVPQGLRACCRVGASCAVGVRAIRRHHRCIGRQRACRRALRRKSGLVAERHPLRRSRRRRQARSVSLAATVAAMRLRRSATAAARSSSRRAAIRRRSCT